MYSEIAKDDQNEIIAGKYQLNRCIGKGAFGLVYRARNILDNKEVAIKLEEIESRYNLLRYEYKIYKKLEGGQGIPQTYQYGQNKRHNYMVTDLLGLSLENLFNYCKRKFSLKTVLMLSDQMLRRLEYIHQKGYIHRDIKPDNFVIGCGIDSTKIFLIDFGLATKYKNLSDNLHIPYTEGHKFIGTLRYASINSQSGVMHSRRDDLESLCYVLIYFLKGSLPWQNIKNEMDRKQRNERILEKKLSTSLSILCTGLPLEFEMFLKYCRERYFDETPNYGYLRKILELLFHRMHFKHDLIFDWTQRSNRKPITR